MPRKIRTNKAKYRPRSVGKGVATVGIRMPEGLLTLVDRMVKGGLGVSRQDVILRAVAEYAVHVTMTPVTTGAKLSDELAQLIGQGAHEVP